MKFFLLKKDGLFQKSQRTFVRLRFERAANYGKGFHMGGGRFVKFMQSHFLAILENFQGTLFSFCKMVHAGKQWG